jgi:hypothetical protein
MGWADEIDVMATQVLEFHHHFRQSLDGYGLPFSQMANGIVLAEETSEIAVGDEDGA